MIAKSQSASLAATYSAVERGCIESRIPAHVERAAIELFESQSLAICGNRWNWDKSSDEVRNRFRLRALIDLKVPIDPG